MNVSTKESVLKEIGNQIEALERDRFENDKTYIHITNLKYLYKRLMIFEKE